MHGDKFLHAVRFWAGMRIEGQGDGEEGEGVDPADEGFPHQQYSCPSYYYRVYLGRKILCRGCSEQLQLRALTVERDPLRKGSVWLHRAWVQVSPCRFQAESKKKEGRIDGEEGEGVDPADQGFSHRQYSCPSPIHIWPYLSLCGRGLSVIVRFVGRW